MTGNIKGGVGKTATAVKSGAPLRAVRRARWCGTSTRTTPHPGACARYDYPGLDLLPYSQVTGFVTLGVGSETADARCFG